MWLCLQGRTRITSQVLGPVTHPENTLGFPPASLPSPLTAGFCGKEHTHISQQKKPIIFITHMTFFFFFLCTRRNYLVLKWREDMLKNSVITNCSHLFAAKGHRRRFSQHNSLTNLGWILLKYCLSFHMPKPNKKYCNVTKSLWLKGHFATFSNYVISFVTTITENSHPMWSTAGRQTFLTVFYILVLTNEKRL